MRANASIPDRRRALPLSGLVVLLALWISFPGADLHRALHERQRAEVAARLACPHASETPVHLEGVTGVVELPCLACLSLSPKVGDGAAKFAGLRRYSKAVPTRAAMPFVSGPLLRLPVPRGPPLV